MKVILDPGHKYEILTLDHDQMQGEIVEQTLTFVKRCDLNDPTRFPGNTNSYPGTTIQSVLRCLLDRLRYLQNQIWSIENIFVIMFLKFALWFMEFRAARRHKHFYFKSLKFAEQSSMCLKCGHTFCKHL